MHWMIRPVETLTILEILHTTSFWKIMSFIWFIPITIIAAILIYKTYRKIA